MFPLVEEYVEHKKSGCGGFTFPAPLPQHVDKNLEKWGKVGKWIRPKKESEVYTFNNYCDICKKELCNENYKRIHMKKVHGGGGSFERVGPVKGPKEPPMDQKTKLMQKFKGTFT